MLTLEAAIHPSVKPIMLTLTMTTNTLALLLPTLKTTLTMLDKPVLLLMLKPYYESKFSFSKLPPFFTFNELILVSPSKFA